MLDFDIVSIAFSPGITSVGDSYRPIRRCQNRGGFRCGNIRAGVERDLSGYGIFPVSVRRGNGIIPRKRPLKNPRTDPVCFRHNRLPAIQKQCENAANTTNQYNHHYNNPSSRSDGSSQCFRTGCYSFYCCYNRLGCGLSSDNCRFRGSFDRRDCHLNSFCRSLRCLLNGFCRLFCRFHTDFAGLFCGFDGVLRRFDTRFGCMPSLGMITLNALTAADSVIIPVQAQYLPAKGMTQLLSTIAKVKKHANRNLTIDGILLTLVDGRTNPAKSTVEALRENFGCRIRIYRTTIPIAVKAAEAASEDVSIYKYEPSIPVAKACTDFTKEVLADGRKKFATAKPSPI